MQANPALSVVMPVYNSQKYVGEAVESILNQTFRDFEFLIIDDGSTDRSPEILRHYEKRDSRIRLTSRSNTGLVVALNEMLALAKGEFIARMDADDISLPQRFEKQAALLNNSPEVVCVGTQFETMDEEGIVYHRSHMPTDPAIIDQEHLRYGYCLLHPTWLVRTAALREIGGYSMECYPAEDNDALLKLGERGGLSNVDQVLFRYRVTQASVSSQNRRRQWEGGNRALENAWKRRGLPGAAPVSTCPPVEEKGSVAGLVSRGWMAWGQGYRRSARLYAGRAVRRDPSKLANWKFLACAWLKDPQKRWLT
jgi:glycosyltransferase involved in cell wall biosynthesis